MVEDSVLSVKNLVKTYKGGVRAVNDVSFEVRRNEVFGIVGPNGAGKSTVMKILVTLIAPTAGRVSISGLERPGEDPGIRKLIGYVPQDISSDGSLTGLENLVLSARLHGLRGREMDDRIDRVLERMDLKRAEDRLTSTYSGGMVRKLEIAQALINTPKILFLDEPTVGLDPAARDAIWKQIMSLQKSSGTTIIITTHYMEEVEALCDTVAIMNRGRIVAMGTPERLKGMTSKAKIVIELKSGKSARVAGMRINGGVARIESDHPDVDLPRYLSLLYAKGLAVRSVSVKEATLDDVFLKFTGRTIGETDHGWRSAKKTRNTMRRLG